jgi:class 3 adenylate cyclase
MLQVARTHWVPITPGSKALLAPDGADEVDSRAIPGEPAVSHTGTATILFTDLVGSTTLRAQLGEERAEAHRQAHHRLLADAIASHRGTPHDDLGDGIMASFPGAADAVAAVAIQNDYGGSCLPANGPCPRSSIS